MDNLIAISTLNDFIFCPYSIYLHNVYMDMDKDAYHSTPQTRGRNAHAGVDNKTTTNNNILESLPVISNELGVYGKIDIYDRSKKILIERKYALKSIYRGQYYQLWAQFFCMVEMGYAVKGLAFYEISTRKSLKLPVPNDTQKAELTLFIERYRNYDPKTLIKISENKCAHCIYCNLCDKTDKENVYS